MQTTDLPVTSIEKKLLQIFDLSIVDQAAKLQNQLP